LDLYSNQMAIPHGHTAPSGTGTPNQRRVHALDALRLTREPTANTALRD
jgi:hypothetical protein